MRNNLRLIGILLRRNLLFSVLYLIEIMLSLAFLTISYNRYEEQAGYLDRFNQPDLHRSIAFFYMPNSFMPLDGLHGDGGAEAFLQYVLRNETDVENIEETQMRSGFVEGVPLRSIGYGPQTMDLFSPHLSEGRLPQHPKGKSWKCCI